MRRSQESGREEDISGFRRFQDLLTEYKRRGCRILVTGDVDQSVMAIQNRYLLGPEAIGRDRTLAVTDVSNNNLLEYIPTAAATDGGVQIVRHQATREATVANAPSISNSARASSGLPQTEMVFNREQTSLVDLRAALVDVVAEYRSRPNTGKSSQLRLGIATLRPLLDTNSTDAVKDFMSIIGDEVVRTRGFVHYLLPVSSTDPVVSSLLPAVDIHIQLRSRSAAEPEHLWHLPEYGETSGWIPLKR